MIPRRMNLVSVKIRKLDEFETPIDSDFREPVSEEFYEREFELAAQVVYESRDRMLASSAGDISTTSGRLVFSTDYLSEKNFVIEKGDKISEIAGGDVDYKIIGVEPSGHINGAPVLTFVFFEHVRETTEVPV